MKRLQKVFAITWLVVSVILVGLILAPFIYIEVNKNVYENKVTDYLVEEEGYTTAEIKNVDGILSFKLPSFYTEVIFENEPNVKYIYYAHNEINQVKYEVIGLDNNIEKSDLKHLDVND